MAPSTSRIARSCLRRDQGPRALRLARTTCIGRRVLTGRSSLRRPPRRAPPCSVRASSECVPGRKRGRCIETDDTTTITWGNVLMFNARSKPAMSRTARDVQPESRGCPCCPPDRAATSHRPPEAVLSHRVTEPTYRGPLDRPTARSERCLPHRSTRAAAPPRAQLVSNVTARARRAEEGDAAAEVSARAVRRRRSRGSTRRTRRTPSCTRGPRCNRVRNGCRRRWRTRRDQVTSSDRCRGLARASRSKPGLRPPLRSPTARR